ncbi:MAG: 50S ribosomal protein L23 [Wolbachia endosymbiont of Meromenopon meropis]|nr:50S ribosomal protein L23 [Wolbachia endosymbiont of Meromenopon meropis]
MIKYNDIIKCPVITEKTSLLREKFGKYSLYVFVSANKYKIKLAIESLFNVKVSSINIVSIRYNVKRKHGRFSDIAGYEKRRKKVYFALANGQKLDIMSV